FTDPATPHLYPLSLHDALPISGRDVYAQRIDHGGRVRWTPDGVALCTALGTRGPLGLLNDEGDGGYLAWGDTRPDGEIFGSQERSEEHTSELQSRGHLVCRLLL